MAIHVTAMITKFFWKNKILIPCVLFAASFIMLTKIFRHNVSDGSKQPVEYLETIDYPDESERKLGRNQLSWNDMEKVDQNVLFRDIYKDFKQKSKGKEVEGQGYLGVKGEGEVEVVEGYERDAWAARTYDPLTLLQDQGHMEFIDLETIDDYVIKAPDVAKDTREQVQYAPKHGQSEFQVVPRVSWKGSYVVKAEVEVNTAYPTKKVYDVYDVYDDEVRKRNYEKSMKEDDGLFKKKKPAGVHAGDKVSIQNNELLNFQYPPVQKYGKKKRKGSKKRRQPIETVVVHLENSEQIDMNVQKNKDVENNENDTDDTTRKGRRMGRKKKKRKKVQDQNQLELRPQDSVLYKQQSQNAQNPAQESHDSVTLTFSPIQGQDQNMVPRKIYLPLDSELAQIQNSNRYVDKQSQRVQNSNQVDSYHESVHNELPANPNFQYQHQNDIPRQNLQPNKQVHNNQQNQNNHWQNDQGLQYQAQSVRFQNFQQQSPQRQHSNNDQTQDINQNNILQQQPQRRTHQQQRKANEAQRLHKNEANQKSSLQQKQQNLSPNMHPPLQNKFQPQTNIHDTNADTFSQQQLQQQQFQKQQVYPDNNQQQFLHIQQQPYINNHNTQQQIYNQQQHNNNNQQQRLPSNQQQSLYNPKQPINNQQQRTTYRQKLYVNNNNNNNQQYQQQQSKPLKYVPMQQQHKSLQQQQQVLQQQQWPRNAQNIRQYGQGSFDYQVVSDKQRGVNSQTIPLPSLGSLISQQNLMLDVQREISEQYAHIQQLQSKLTIANYVAKEMEHKPHEVLSDTHKEDVKSQGHVDYGPQLKKNQTHINRYSNENGIIAKDAGHMEANRQWSNARPNSHVRSEDIVLGDGKGDVLNVGDKPHVYGGGDGDHRGNGLLHVSENGKVFDRFGNVIPNSDRREGPDGGGEFKLKHRRKPKLNQTRVFAFENHFNESMPLGGNLSVNPYDIYSNTMFPLNFTLDLAGIRQKVQKLSDQTIDTGKFTRHLRKTLYRDPNVNLELFSQWRSSKDTLCPDSDVFEGYDDKFARLRNVVIDKQFGVGKIGGENINDVINQAEGAEYYKVHKGFWQVYCKSHLRGDGFMGNHHINEWFYALEDSKDPNPDDATVINEFTIAVVRYEYANLYHTMTDFYNAFLVMEFFNKTQAETNILLIDGHPKSNLDETWRTLFNSTKRVGALPAKTRFTDLAWSIVGYESAMNEHYMMQLPLVEEFHNFFLSTYDVPHDVKDGQNHYDVRGGGHTLNCDSLSVLLIWRRDYVAHPRNPSGFIQRKMQNEQELVTKLRKKFSNYTIRGVQIDLFDMKQQLDFITTTDILIGMHGAGLTHAMFLPKHAGIIELIPNYWSAANMHFEAIATWRNLYFDRWTNEDPRNEAPNYSTTIPPEVVIALIKNMARPMCNARKDHSAYHSPGYNYNNLEDNTQTFKTWNSDE